MNKMWQWCGAVALILGFGAALRAETLWIEAEDATTLPAEAKVGGWSNQSYLSGEKWVTVQPAKGAEKMPAEGVVLAYTVQAPKAGTYEFWNRLGWENVRSPIEWRFDGGAWQTFPPTVPNRDTMELSLWCELSWAKLGKADLTAGPHKLEIRLRPAPGEDKKSGKILYGSDVLVLSTEPFHPNGKYKPGEAYQSDADRAAGKQVFKVPAGTAAGERVETGLGGAWEIARSDEDVLDDRTGPIKALPPAEELFWRAMTVPGDKDKAHPEWQMAHRCFYRARVEVPADLGGRSFFLHFPSVNMIATVFVNGKPCGFTRAPFTVWDCDVTAALKPGQVNEIVVGIKDTYYALAGGEKRDARASFNTPPAQMHTNQGVTMQFDFPIYGQQRNGILETPSLVAAGAVYAADVFAKPSVSKKELALEVTLKNPTATEVNATVSHTIVPLGGKAAEKTFASKTVKVPAGGETVFEMTEAWANPKLWWPDDPQQYEAVTTVSLDGKVVDTKKTKFGFREWGWGSDQFTLNGIPWHGRADTFQPAGKNPEEAIAVWKRHGQNMMRFWATSWGGLGQQEFLDAMDRGGMVVRRSGIFDGEHASYGLVEAGPDGKGKSDRQPRKDLFEHWQEQVIAQVRGERNHPAVLIWSIENEVTYINSANRGIAPVVEPAIAKVAKAVMQVDPTRPAMVDGGNALLDESLPVNGVHYFESAQLEYPDRAYDKEWMYTVKHRIWPMARNKPVFLGESYFANGFDPGWFAGVGGESCFTGRDATRPAVSLFARMLSEGYRWQGIAAFHYWFGQAGDNQTHYISWQPIAVLCRQWNSTFGGGTTVPRTLKVLNDTRFSDPIEVSWELKVDGKTAGQDKKTLTVPAGTGQEWEVSLAVPPVQKRTGGEFILTASQKGQEVFREAKTIQIIDAQGAPKPALSKEQLVVLDPKGPVLQRLKQRGIECTPASDPEKIPATAKVVVVGPDALAARWATDPLWLTLAAKGVRVVVLDQTYPLHYQAVPADLEVTQRVGRVAFAEDIAHPIFAALDQSDFFCWSGDNVVWRNAYEKATRGAASLVQCDAGLTCSAVAQCPVDEGLLLLSQLAIGKKLGSDPVAQRIFDNMLNYAASYQITRNQTALVMNPDHPTAKMLARAGLKFDPALDPVAALAEGKHQIVIVEATPANLKALVAKDTVVRTFTEGGGHLMLWGLTPEGLADFNRLVGVQHVLRPFERERVTMAAVRDPLGSGLTARDVVLQSGEKIFAWQGLRWAVDDEFTYVVDGDDIAPFGEFPGVKAGPRAPGEMTLRNLVNGFVNSDSWKYIYYFPQGEDGKWGGWTMNLPQPEEVVEISLAQNMSYQKISKLQVFFDDDPTPLTISPQPTEGRQDFPIDGRKVSKKLTFTITECDGDSPKNTTGIDNLWIKVKRSEDFYRKVKPLLNIGALVRYPMGKGDIVLNQLRILPTEENPVNAEKKQVIAGTLLRNLGAVFTGGRPVVENLVYTPVSLENQYNQYITSDRGWWDEAHDLKSLPDGQVKLGGVPFMLNAFKTSPVPACVMLAGVRGIKAKLPKEVSLKVDLKAQVLVFLHTAKQLRELPTGKKGKEVEPPVAFTYVVHYADGKTVEVPVVLNEGVADWLTVSPQGLKDAALAWAAKAGGKPEDPCAALWALKWHNPRPDEAIKQIDLVYAGKQVWAVPALLAITAGQAAP